MQEMHPNSLLLLSLCIISFSLICRRTNQQHRGQQDRERNLRGWDQLSDTARMLNEDVARGKKSENDRNKNESNGLNKQANASEGPPVRTDKAKPLRRSAIAPNAAGPNAKIISRAKRIIRRNPSDPYYMKMKTALEMGEKGKHPEAFQIGWSAFEVGVKEILSIQNGGGFEVVREFGDWLAKHNHEIDMNTEDILLQVDMARKIRNVCEHESPEEQRKFRDKIQKSSVFIANLILSLALIERIEL